MSEEEILNEIDFCLAGEYITIEHRQAIEGLLKMYQQEKEKNKKLKDVINNLAKGVRYLGTNEELAEEDIIKMFSPEEIKMDFDDFMKRWEDKQHKEAKLKEKVIKLMASDMERLGSTDELIEYYFKKARGEK